MSDLIQFTSEVDQTRLELWVDTFDENRREVEALAADAEDLMEIEQLDHDLKRNKQKDLDND